MNNSPKHWVLTGYSCSLLGTRELNQDAFLVAPEKGLFAVADGVGGGMRGEVASRMAVEGLAKHCTETISLKNVFETLQKEILLEALESLGEALMGTTLTAVRIHNGEVQLCHCGDSRCYVFDGNELHLKTKDHEAFDELSQNTVLSSYLGIPSDVHPITIMEAKFPIQPGQTLLLCSDGLYRQLSEQHIVGAMKKLKDYPERLVEDLCSEAALFGDYSDNVTAVLVTVSTTTDANSKSEESKKS